MEVVKEEEAEIVSKDQVQVVFTEGDRIPEGATAAGAEETETTAGHDRAIEIDQNPVTDTTDRVATHPTGIGTLDHHLTTDNKKRCQVIHPYHILELICTQGPIKTQF